MPVLYDLQKNEVQITATSYKTSGEKANIVIVIDSDTINAVRKLTLNSLYGQFAIQCVKTARTLPIKQGADYELHKALELLKRALDY